MKFRTLVCLTAIILFAALAASWGQSPTGYVYPPYHLNGNASATPVGLTPQEISHAYGFDQIRNQGAGQVIGIVDAYDDPNIESDLAVFNTTFGLPACTTANGCFTKIFAAGTEPKSSGNWAVEIAADVEWAHALAPQAKILLVEMEGHQLGDLAPAVDVAVQNGATVVSMSLGASEFPDETNFDSHFAVNGVTFCAASGDHGTLLWPAASPLVVGVGGTTLNVDSNGNYLSETAWSGSGGGQSSFELEPSYQSSFPIPNDTAGKRGVPDVAYDADPTTGFAEYDTFHFSNFAGGWVKIGGTSLGTPQWAALFAIVNSLRAARGSGTLSGTDIALYSAATRSYASDYHDITSGTNGTCGALCTATVGYDYVTGLGSPQAGNLVNALAKF